MRSLKIAFALIFLSIVPANCTNAQEIDLSTDETVIAELQKLTDMKNAERTKADETLEAKRRAASKLNPKHVCIKRFKESPNVIVIGSFRYDYGCHFAGAFVGSQYFEAGNIEIHKNALDAFGWEKADQNAREKLVRLWVEKGLLAFFTVLQTKPKELENFDFRPPQIVTTEEGEIKITLCVRMPSGRRPKNSFQYFEFRFTKDGNFSGKSTLYSGEKLLQEKLKNISASKHHC